MEREFFFDETQEELAQSVCATLSETSGALWRMERWSDMRWHVVRETTEEEIRWSPATPADVAEWVSTGLDFFMMRSDDELLEDVQPGDELVDSREWEIGVRRVNMTPVGQGTMTTFEFATGKADTRRKFRIDVWPTLD